MKRLTATLLTLMLLVFCLPAMADTMWTFNVSLTELESDHAILVNRDNLLDESYKPQDMVKMTVKCASSTKIELREVAADALVNMFEDATAVTEYTYKVQSSDGSWKEKTFSSERLF